MYVTRKVLELPLSRRQCITSGDYQYDYRQPACTLKCLRDAVYKYCKCHPYQLPRFDITNNANNIRNCSVTDAYCFVENYCNITYTSTYISFISESAFYNFNYYIFYSIL